MSIAIQSNQEDVESLLAYNAARFEQHKRLRSFQFFTDGTLEDPAKREVFFSCLQVFARHFQTMLLMRQAHCADDRYGALFSKHLREESGHDDVLRKGRGRSDEIWDPVIEGACAWFISRMSILDNIEKTVVIHLVLESSGAYMGTVSRGNMGRFGSADYFELHDELDPSHVTVAFEPLYHQAPETLTGLRRLIDQAWRMLDLFVNRVADLVLGAEADSSHAPESG